MVRLLPGLNYAHNNIVIWVDFSNCHLITVIELTTSSVSVFQAEIFCCKRSNVFHIISGLSNKIQLIYIPVLYQGCVVCVCVCACANARVQVHSVVSNSLWPHGLWPIRLLCPWNFPGKNTGVDCHFLLQRVFLIQELNLHSCISCVSRWVLYQLSHQGSPIRGMCTLLIFLTKDSSLMMVGVKTLIRMASSMSLLEYVAQWKVTITSLWPCSEESHCLSNTTRPFWMSC